MWRIAMWSDDQIKAMDMYLWLDFSIEVLWGWYMEQYMGNTQTTVEDEVIILRTMGLVYSLLVTASLVRVFFKWFKFFLIFVS